MVFSSVIFLGIFFPVFLVLYFACKKIVYKNLVLVVFSIFFYAWGEPVWVLLLLFSGTMDYINGRVIGRYKGKWQAKGAVILSVTVNLGILALFKYSNFFVDNINSIFNLSVNIPVFNLPLGISFYTFQTLTYTIDAYRGKFPPQKSLLNYLTYLTMFPQLVAGPIVRYSDIEKRLNARRVTFQGFSDGITRFAAGLGKKVLFANPAGSVAQTLLDGDLTKLTGLGAWLGIIMYTFQIYFDFSGYSDMAIGMGKMIGFDFKENFNYPYTAKSITDFWRRWHMSLSTFFRDYVYIPLGGNRRLQLRNLFAVWFLTGLWHGASWNFILWGLYYLVILIIEKYLLNKIIDKIPALIRHIYSLALITGGWMIFYFTDLGRLKQFLKAGFFFNGASDFLAASTLAANAFLIVVLAIAVTPLPKKAAGYLRRKFAVFNGITPLFNILTLAGCFILILGQTYNPFLYFRF